MANSAVVGTLRAILSADTAEFASAMNKAAASADQASKDIAKTGQAFQALEPRMASVTRLVKDFSGSFERRSADEFAMAIERVGGAARLSERELSRASGVFSDYISKARALGQEVPPHIAKVSAEIEKLRDTSGRGAGIIGQIKEAFTNLGPSMVAAAGGFLATLISVEALTSGLRAGIAFLKESVNQAAEAEKAQRKLTAALEAQKTATPETVRAYKELADQFQRTTVFSDELIMEMETLLIQVGNVMPKDMEAALDAVTNLASGLGIDLRSATMMVAKAAEDNFTALKRQGVQIDETKAKAEGFAYVLGQVNAKFGGQAAADLNTFNGQLKATENQFSELQETIGDVIIKSTAFQIAFALLRAEIAKTEHEIKFIVTTMKALGSMPGPVGTAFQLLIGDLKATGNSIKEIEARQADFFRMKFGANAALPTEWTNYVKILDEAKKKVNDLSPATRKAIDEEIKAREALKKPLDDLAAKYGLTSEMLVVLTSKTKDSTKAVREQTSEYAKWAETVTGAGLLRDLATLETRLQRLTKEGGLNSTAMKNIAKEADELGRKIGFLPPKLQTLVNQFIGFEKGVVSSALALPRFDDKLDVTGDELRDLAKQFQDVNAKFESFNKIINTQKGMQDLFKGGLTSKDLEEAQAAIGTFKDKATNAFFIVGNALQNLRVITDDEAGQIAAAVGGIAIGLGQLASGDYVSGAIQIAGALSGMKTLWRNVARDMQDAFATRELGFEHLNALLQHLRDLGRSDLATAGDIAQKKDDEEATRKWMEDVIEFLNEVDLKFQRASEAAQEFGGKAPAALQPLVQQLLLSNKLTEEQRLLLQGLAGAPEWKQLQAIAEKYGITLESLGQNFQDARLTDIAMQYARDFMTLRDAGADVSGVLEGMKDEVQELVLQSLKFGVALPEALRDVVNGLIGMGQLVDENGNALTDLTRINFKGTIEDAFIDIKGILEEIRDLLAGGLPRAAASGAKGVEDEYKGAFGRIRNAVEPIRIPIEFDTGAFAPPEGFGLTPLQHGGIVRRPTPALLGEAGPEAVIPLDQLDNRVVVENKLFIDGREVTVAVVQHMRETARRLGVRPI